MLKLTNPFLPGKFFNTCSFSFSNYYLIVRFDAPSGESRIDYYGGMVKTYQLKSYGLYGTSLKLAPVTTEDELNVNECLQINGTEEMNIEIQSVLPDLTGFECIGEELVNGLETEKWQLKQDFGEKVNKYTMWMMYKDDPNDPKIKYAVPIRFLYCRF